MVAAKRCAGTTDDGSGLASYCGGPHTTSTHNLCPEHTLIHNSHQSFRRRVPTPRFAATMRHYLIKIWNPTVIVFLKRLSGQNPTLIWSHRRASPLGFATRLGVRNAQRKETT